MIIFTEELVEDVKPTTWKLSSKSAVDKKPSSSQQKPKHTKVSIPKTWKPKLFEDSWNHQNTFPNLPYSRVCIWTCHELPKNAFKFCRSYHFIRMLLIGVFFINNYWDILRWFALCGVRLGVLMWWHGGILNCGFAHGHPYPGTIWRHSIRYGFSKHASFYLLFNNFRFLTTTCQVFSHNL